MCQKYTVNIITTTKKNTPTHPLKLHHDQGNKKTEPKWTIDIITATAKQPKNEIKLHHQNHRGKQ